MLRNSEETNLFCCGVSSTWFLFSFSLNFLFFSADYKHHNEEGDFNIHLNFKNDCLNAAFKSILYMFYYDVPGPIHYFHNMLALDKYLMMFTIWKINQKLTPWFHSELHTLKQTTRKLERLWPSTRFWGICLDKEAFGKVRTTYYSTLIE